MASMKPARPAGVLALALLAAVACNGAPTEGTPPAPAPAVAKRQPPVLEAEPAADEQKMPEPPPDHRPSSAADRALIADLYLAFAAEPGGFADKITALTPAQRRQAWGFLFCAAPRMLAAGQEDGRTGAPVTVALPPEADELIEYQGPRERARLTLLRQLAGEFVVVGRAIQSIDRGERRIVDGVIARQRRNLEMMRTTAGPGHTGKWNERIRRVFPALFSSLLPEC
jgi:hypothetical protein